MAHITPREAGKAPRPRLVLEDQTLREALQMHPRLMPVEERMQLMSALVGAGLRRFQVASLVRPDRMPQMAVADELLSRLRAWPGVELWALVFNHQGLARAFRTGLRHVALSASLSPVHSQSNLNCPVEHALTRSLALAGQALRRGMTVRMGLQCAFGGPMLAPPQPEELARLLGPFARAGVESLALADTTGRADAAGVAAALAALRREMPEAELGLHLHGEPDGLEPILEAAWDGGADWMDVTLAGHGGCPFLPKRPPGNLAVEQAARFLAGKGVDTGLDLDRLSLAADMLDGFLCASEPAPRRQRCGSF